MTLPAGRTPEEDRQIALHEAGHAVMAERMRMVVDIVSADPDGCGRNGYCDYCWRAAENETEQHCHWRRCVVAYAGAVAESVFFGGEPDSILFDRRDDMKTFNEVRDKLQLPHPEWVRFCHDARAEAQAGTDRRRIEAVADRLQACRRMTGDQLSDLLAQISCRD